MKPKFVGIIFFIFIFSLLGAFLFSQPVLAAGKLIKSAEFDTVYYVDQAGVRHIFPNSITYQSWYGTDFSSVESVSKSVLAQYPLGKNITVRPGKYLIKIRTAPEVYAVEQGGVLREIGSEELAITIYGQDWASRIVDVPDVFFDDYTIGKPITGDYDIADNILYQNSDTGKYYYKSQGVLRPFGSTAAISANYFKLSEAVSMPNTYYVRQRPINGFDQSIFNPTAQAITDKRDCENKNLKAAVIFLIDEGFKLSQLAKIEEIKAAAPERFAWVTDDFSSIDFDYETIVIKDDGYLIQSAGNNIFEVKNEVINTFYDTNPDIFDFIFVFTVFETTATDKKEIAHFTPVTNLQKGTGANLSDFSGVYGSQGKLKGIIMMGNIDKYSTELGREMNETLNIVMHEILHQWSGYLEFIDEEGRKSASLLRSPDYKHWSYYAGWLSPVGGSGWIDNKDGTFTSELSQMPDSNLRKYSKIDLYAMGLIPYQLMDPVFYIEPEVSGDTGNTIKGKAIWLTVNQLIKANGYVACEQN